MIKTTNATPKDIIRISNIVLEQSFHERMNMAYKDVEFWINSLRDIYSKSKFNVYDKSIGLNSGSVKRFLRRIHNFEYYLATQILEAIEDGVEGFYLSSGKSKFVTNILIGALILYFSVIEEKDFDGEDFMRNGSKEEWFHLVKEIYGDYLSEKYETFSEM